MVSYVYHCALFTVVACLAGSDEPTLGKTEASEDSPGRAVSCSKLASYHMRCRLPEIDSETQQPSSCQQNRSTFVWCETVGGINCAGVFANGTFLLEVPDSCDPTAHLRHSTALLLSIFFGFLGLDRFYLGYYAIGAVKLFSLGGLLIIYLIDVIFIALKLLGPADGSSYVMPYYGPHTSPLRFDNSTYLSVTPYAHIAL